MRKQIRYILLACAAVMPAQASIVFSDGFETGGTTFVARNPDTVVEGTAVWVTAGGASTAAIVDDGGNNVMEFVNAGIDTFAVEISGTLVSGQMTFDARFTADTTDITRNANFRAAPGQNTGLNDFRSGVSLGAVGLTLNTWGEVSIVFNAGTSTLVYGDSGQYSVAPDTVDIWVNGQLISDDKVRDAGSGGLNVFGFKVFDGVVGMVFQIDNFQLDTVITVGGTPARPNILMLCIDDMNDWVGFLGGHPQTKTPNMDSLAAMGAVFSNAHCPAPGCSPSRNAIMFGAQPTTTGLCPFYSLVNLDATDRATLDAFLPMPKFSRDNGYYTAGYTKVWHNPDNAYKKAEQWDVYQSFGNSSLQLVDDPKYYISLDNKRFRATPANNPPTHFGDRKSANAAVGILQQTHAKPFFLAVGFILPHTPFVTPIENYDRFDFPIEAPAILAGDLADVPLVGRANAQLYADIPVKQDNAWEKLRRGYLASISFTDDNVGLVLDSLAASPYADNTIVVLWSDHGFHLGEKQSFSKFSLWEEATRTPFIIYDPRGKAANGQTISEPVSLIDMYRTLAELAGLNPPAYVDGASLVSLLDDPSLKKTTPAMTTWGRGNYTLRSTDWHHTRYHDGSEELYHNAADPNEWTNLAGDPQYNAMKNQLAVYLPTTEAPQIQSGIELYNVSDADRPSNRVSGYLSDASEYETLGLQPPLNGYSFSEWIEMAGYVGNDALPGADPNTNGVPNILEYAIKVPEGGDVRDYLPGLVFEPEDTTHHLAMTFRRRLEAPDPRYVVEGSKDLTGGWDPLWNSDTPTNAYILSTTYNADGMQTITVRHEDAIADEPNGFLRLGVRLPRSATRFAYERISVRFA